MLESFGLWEIPWRGWFRSLEGSKEKLLFLPVLNNHAGVAIFFAVSGFCIHLSHARRSDWNAFYIKRFFRIYPPYLLALLFFALFYGPTRIDLGTSAGTQQLFSHLFLIHNHHPDYFGAINPSFWSIVIEVQLYLLYPLMLTLIDAFGWKKTLSGIAILEITLRLGWSALFSLDLAASSFSSIDRIPFTFWFSWAIGAFVADRYVRGKTFVVKRRILTFLLFAAFGLNWFKPTHSLVFTLVATLTALWIMRSIAAIDSKKCEQSGPEMLLARIGVISYGIYLIHQPLLYLARPLAARFVTGWIAPLHVYASCLSIALIAIFVSVAFYKLIEVPCIGIGSRRAKRKTI